MNEILEAEAQTFDGEKKKKRCRQTVKGKDKEVDLNLEDDAEYVGSSSESVSSSDEGNKSDEVEISNAEVSKFSNFLSNQLSHLSFITASRFPAIENHSYQPEANKESWKEVQETKKVAAQGG